MNVDLVKGNGKQFLYLLPAAAFLSILLVAAAMLLRISFGTQGNEFTAWSLAAYSELLEPIYLRSIWLTLRISAIVTLITILLAYPFAMFMVDIVSPTLRRIAILCLMLPLLMNLVLQSFGWLVLLAPDGVINRALISMGVVQRPYMFLFNEVGVIIGMVQTTLPLAVFPIATALSKIPRSVQDAAAILGANRLTVLRNIVVPLSAPGLIAAALLAFATSMSAFIVPFLLGGRRVSMLAVLIRDQMGPLLNWPLGAASSIVLVIISLLVMIFYQRFAAGTKQ